MKNLTPQEMAALGRDFNAVPMIGDMDEDCFVLLDFDTPESVADGSGRTGMTAAYAVRAVVIGAVEYAPGDTLPAESGLTWAMAEAVAEAHSALYAERDCD